jgi:hypothetical protein
VEDGLMDMEARCKTCGMQRGEHDRACVNEQLHALRMRIVKRLVAWRTQYETPPLPDGQIDLNVGFKACVDSAIRMVRETE